MTTSKADIVYPELARIAAALASPVRLRALNLLMQSPKSLEQLAGELGESQANTTAHLKTLRAAGLVQAERRGKYLFQRPAGDPVVQLFFALRDAGESLNPTIALLNEHTDEALLDAPADEWEQLLQDNNPLLLDLRPEAEFAAGHLPGAQSVPMNLLPQRLNRLPKRRRILAYCRGRYCQEASRGVKTLRSAGFNAMRLPFGVAEWMGSGRNLERLDADLVHMKASTSKRKSA